MLYCERILIALPSSWQGDVGGMNIFIKQYQGGKQDSEAILAAQLVQAFAVNKAGTQVLIDQYIRWKSVKCQQEYLF